MAPKGVIVVPDLIGGRRSHPSACPSIALQQVANRPIVCHAVDALAHLGVRDVVVVAPASVREEVRACIGADSPSDVETRFAEPAAGDPLTSPLAQAAPLVGDSPCIVHVADGLLVEPLGPLVDSSGSQAADLIVLVHHGASEADGSGLTARRLLRLAELDPRRDPLGLAGVFALGPGVLRLLDGADHLGGVELDLTAIADRLVRDRRRLEIRDAGWCRYRGDVRDLLGLNRMVLDRLVPDPPRLDDGENRIDGRVVISPSARVVCSSILGPTIIGPHAEIVNACVGPYTAIGHGARIDGVEIDHSIIGPGAFIAHLGTRLVASVVGRDARIFRDFSLPRAMRLQVGEGVQVALS